MINNNDQLKEIMIRENLVSNSILKINFDPRIWESIKLVDFPKNDYQVLMSKLNLPKQFADTEAFIREPYKEVENTVDYAEKYFQHNFVLDTVKPEKASKSSSSDVIGGYIDNFLTQYINLVNLTVGAAANQQTRSASNTFGSIAKEFQKKVYNRISELERVGDDFIKNNQNTIEKKNKDRKETEEHNKLFNSYYNIANMKVGSHNDDPNYSSVSNLQSFIQSTSDPNFKFTDIEQEKLSKLFNKYSYNSGGSKNNVTSINSSKEYNYKKNIILNEDESSSNKINNSFDSSSNTENIDVNNTDQYLIIDANKIYEETLNGLKQELINIVPDDIEAWRCIIQMRNTCNDLKNNATSEIAKRIEIICNAKVNQNNTGGGYGSEPQDKDVEVEGSNAGYGIGFKYHQQEYRFRPRVPLQATGLVHLWKRYAQELNQRLNDRIIGIQKSESFQWFSNFIKVTGPNLLSLMITMKYISWVNRKVNVVTFETEKLNDNLLSDLKNTFSEYMEKFNQKLNELKKFKGYIILKQTFDSGETISYNDLKRIINRGGISISQDNEIKQNEVLNIDNFINDNNITSLDKLDEEIEKYNQISNTSISEEENQRLTTINNNLIGFVNNFSNKNNLWNYLNYLENTTSEKSNEPSEAKDNIKVFSDNLEVISMNKDYVLNFLDFYFLWKNPYIDTIAPTEISNKLDVRDVDSEWTRENFETLEGILSSKDVYNEIINNSKKGGENEITTFGDIFKNIDLLNKFSDDKIKSGEDIDEQFSKEFEDAYQKEFEKVINKNQIDPKKFSFMHIINVLLNSNLNQERNSNDIKEEIYKIDQNNKKEWENLFSFYNEDLFKKLNNIIIHNKSFVFLCIFNKENISDNTNNTVDKEETSENSNNQTK